MCNCDGVQSIIGKLEPETLEFRHIQGAIDYVELLLARNRLCVMCRQNLNELKEQLQVALNNMGESDVPDVCAS